MIERAAFGRSGHASSRVIFGAAGLARMSQAEADPLLELLFAHGVNHIDTAAGYGDSELRLAPWMAVHRREFFLATKTGERSGDAARASLERSLERLGVDQVDLIQLHNLVEEDDWAVAHGPDGAVAALARARDEGLVRFIGVTGHGLRIPAMHLRSLDRFDFDSVLFPYNFPLLQDADYRRSVEALLALCAERDVATQAIKGIARRRWIEPPQPRRSWYEPLPEGAALARAVAFLLATPQLFLVSSSDPQRLAATLAAAEQRAPAPDTEELEADVVRHQMRPLFDGAALERI